MVVPQFPRLTALWTQSVARRLTLVSLAVFLVASVALGVAVTHLLRKDMAQVLVAEQLSATHMAAETLERELSLRIGALEQVGALAGERLREGPIGLQRVLDGAPVLRRLFNGGGFITDAQGVAIAAWPYGSGRIGVNYADRDYLRQVQATGRPAVGVPVIGRAIGRAAIPMAAPIRNARGELAGVIVGGIEPGSADFLDDFHGRHFGETGEYLLVEPTTRTVISATNPARVMSKLSPLGSAPDLDRILSDFEGTRIMPNRDGTPVVATVQRVTATGWVVIVSTPVKSAFGPAYALERRLLASIAVLAVSIALVLWFAIRIQLRPLDQAANRLAAVEQAVRAGQLPHEVPVQRPDEVGRLMASFNGLLGELGRRQEALTRSELLYSTAFQISPDPVTITRLRDGTYLRINDSFTRVFGWREEELLGRTAPSVGIWRRIEDRRLMMDMLGRVGRVDNLETEMITRDGRMLAVQVSASVMILEGERCLLAITHDITARRQAQRQIETLAFSDPLTGLPNRRLLTDRLGQALADARRDGQHVALLFIDLDDFKQLNDSQGHAAGDKLLRAVAGELRSALRLTDTVARLGGDEFVVLLKDLPADRGEAAARTEEVARSLREATARGAARLGSTYHASVSIGIALGGPERIDGPELMRHADLAMYRAKALGRGQVALFSQNMLDTLSSRAALESDLRAALGSTQICLHYQPQVGPQGRILGAEALVRWTRPGQGPVSPAIFIPVAEDTGLILPLGRWILQTACQQLAAWAQDPATAHLVLAVNVSSRQFQQTGFVDEIRDALRQTGAPATRLRLELTESVLVDNFDAVATRMEALKELGVGFSLDDFGTGFSSLGYLKRLPLDELKIDASFVREIETDANDQAIAAMVVALGRTLGLQVLAEGVETAAQRDLLAAMGCEHYQGYLFSRPQPIEQFQELIHAQAGTAPA